VKGAYLQVLPGLTPYGTAMAEQENLAAARSQHAIPDVVMLLEHEPVISLGSRAVRGEELLLAAVAYAIATQDRMGSILFVTVAIATAYVAVFLVSASTRFILIRARVTRALPIGVRRRRTQPWTEYSSGCRSSSRITLSTPVPAAAIGRR